jgi:hypothetical protein
VVLYRYAALFCTFRYENNDYQGVGAAMTMNIGAMKSETSGPIGKDNCVEVIVPGQIGTYWADNAVLRGLLL